MLMDFGFSQSRVRDRKMETSWGDLRGQNQWRQMPSEMCGGCGEVLRDSEEILLRPKASRAMHSVEKLKRMKLLEAIEVIRGFAEEEKFQERLQKMQQESPTSLRTTQVEDTTNGKIGRWLRQSK